MSSTPGPHACIGLAKHLCLCKAWLQLYKALYHHHNSIVLYTSQLSLMLGMESLQESLKHLDKLQARVNGDVIPNDVLLD